MDDTQQSRASDAAATRKRRSSILKSQRPPRTPFSDLEFNVATPTDSAKSRRVSFSRRTGVAEFATNEATTTWKNFYEEHNKSLESSGNESGSKQPVAHLGRRVFDQQFEEVEADFIATLNTGPNINISSSLNNFEQQLAALENTDNIKLTAPINNFELSAFTNNHTKFFDDQSLPNGEVTGLKVNFSTVQIGDDLDEIQNDLKQNFGNACPRQEISEYIEVDFNMTRLKNEDDMSITDTIHSPKVQEVSKSKSIDFADKENIVMNPYVAPKEAENFAINEELDKVLVFDGKRLTIQTDVKENYRQTLIPNVTEKAPQRKTIVLNVNDDLPNFIDDFHISSNSALINPDLKKSFIEPIDIKQRTVLYNDESGNISVTQAINKPEEKRRTILYENNGNISITQAIPTNIIAEKRKTIMFEDGNLSMTQALPTNLQENMKKEKRKTILFEDGNISMTQVLPTNLQEDIKSEKRKTILFQDGNISMTQALPTHLQENLKIDKRKTILFEDGNISMTQALPTNLQEDIKSEKRKTILFEDGNISMTQALPTNLQENLKNEKRKTILFEDGNISVTQALPVNILPETKRRTIVYEDNAGNLSITQAIPNIQITEAKAEKRRTIVYEDDTGNISVTQAVPSNIIFSENDRRRTVVFESDTGNISVTQAVPSSLVLQNQVNLNSSKSLNECRRRTIVYEKDTGNLSITQAVPNNVIQEIAQNIETNTKAIDETKRRTIVFENDGDISMTQTVPAGLIDAIAEQTVKEEQTKINKENEKRRTVVFDNDDADISITQALPVNVIENINIFRSDSKRRTVVFEDDNDVSITQPINHVPVITNVHDDLEDALNEALHRGSGKTQRSIVFDNENLNLSVQTSTVPNLMEDESIAAEGEKEISVLLSQERKSPRKIRTIAFEEDISTTQAPANIMEKEIESKDDEMDTVSSHSKDSNTSQILDVSMADMNEDGVQDEVMKINEEKVNSVTKPIPAELFNIINESDSKSASKTKNSIMDSNKNTSRVLVYQTALTKRIEQGDTKSQDPGVTEDEKMSTSSKIVEEKQNEAASSETEVKQNNETIPPPNNVEDIESNQTIQEQEKEMGPEKESDIPTDIPDDQSEASSIMSKSILHDLLDMTEDDKCLMTQTPDPQNLQDPQDSDKVSIAKTANSSDTLFYITKDEDDAKIQTEKSDETPQLTEHSPLPLEYKEESELVEVQKKLEVIKDAIREELSPTNRHYEKIVSPELDKTKEKNKYKANNTNELLDLLTDLTDKTMTKRLDAHLEEDEEQPDPILVKGHLALENKHEETEPRRLSFAPRRQSIVMSREDLLNNMSMAGAALKSRLDFDSEVEDSPEKSPKKSVRHSNEVVKTLQFDESLNESHSDVMTPLKKTAFGETSYMQEHRSKVIPDFLKNVSDGIKELMDDLVKPNADVLPFDAAGVDKGVRRIPSTCSTQIQANIITSSQIDINTGLYSNPDSIYDVNINKISSVDIINDAVNRSVSRALKSPIKSSTTVRQSDKSMDSKLEVSITDVQTIIPARPTEPVPGRVLIFDHSNPLNNICLAPDKFTEVHRYNPGNSNDTISERSHSVQMSFTDRDNYEVERVSTQYNVGSVLRSVQQSGDSKIAESQSKMSNLSKPMSIDQSTDAKLSDVKNTEVNTLIAMKGNKELLDASSSLTLVDDALARSTFDVDVDSRATTSQEDTSKSPVRVIYTVRDDLLSDKMDSDFTSNDESEKKPQKRIYSPANRDKHKHCTISSLDVTPKPTVKMQKLSQSPNKSIDVTQSEKTHEVEKKRKSPRKKNKKPGTTITVQQLMTEYKVGPIDHDTLDEQIKDLDPKSDTSSIEPTQSQSDVDTKSLDVVSSFTSSKNLREDRSAVTSQSSKVSRMDWQPEVLDNVSSKNLDGDCDSSSNVVAKIDMLPFMGSHECEWESSSGDTWSFRLLHGRLRLGVRLEHRHDNAARTRVRADTPVRAVTIEVLPYDKKNALASLCVTFAAETMRYFISRGCATAGDVPPLVRRCAAAARLAARWARAMGDARAHLAFCLTHDAVLTLKVANISLRCVWEVSMRLELVVGDAREAPWVRAGGVRVRRVLPAGPPAPLPRVLRHLPRDWSHAPRAIWRIFKYLKHKTREDDELFLEM